MKYNNRLATLLAQQVRDQRAKTALWAQIADILAQDAARLDPEQQLAGYARLREWRSEIPAERRQVTSESLSFHVLPSAMVGLFGEEPPRIAAPIMNRAILDDAEWLALIPAWPPTSRALLRERRDLPPETSRMLSAYGTSDMMLAGDAGPVQQASAPIQIRDLVARIEAYRRDHQVSDQTERRGLMDFRFEIGADGLLDWVEGAPRGPLVGLSFAELADPGGFGVDGHAAGAFRQRAVFRDARLTVPGAGEAAGIWLVSADPLFNPGDGRFLGYRGVARRPGPHVDTPSPVLGGGLSPDSMRQLVHELRTPLNAIRGFGEMIEARLLGPVAHVYRERAGRIVGDTARLLSVIDDLDSAARLQSGSWPDTRGGHTDLAAVLGAVAEELRPWSDQKAVRFRVLVERDVPEAQIDQATAARLLSRLLETVVGLAAENEELGAKLATTSSGISFGIDRPKAIHGLSDEQLMASASVENGEDADGPPLGTGFTLRLISGMARASGGHFEIARDRFSLILPAVGDSARETKESV